MGKGKSNSVLLSLALAAAFALSSVSQAAQQSKRASAQNSKRVHASSPYPANKNQRVASSPSRRPTGMFAGSAGLKSASGEAGKPLKVQGQSRNLSMMLVLKGEKDKIKFGEIRQDYKKEVLKTNY